MGSSDELLRLLMEIGKGNTIPLPQSLPPEVPVMQTPQEPRQIMTPPVAPLPNQAQQTIGAMGGQQQQEPQYIPSASTGGINPNAATTSTPPGGQPQGRGGSTVSLLKALAPLLGGLAGGSFVGGGMAQSMNQGDAIKRQEEQRRIENERAQKWQTIQEAQYKEAEQRRKALVREQVFKQIDDTVQKMKPSTDARFIRTYAKSRMVAAGMPELAQEAEDYGANLLESKLSETFALTPDNKPIMFADVPTTTDPTGAKVLAPGYKGPLTREAVEMLTVKGQGLQRITGMLLDGTPQDLWATTAGGKPTYMGPDGKTVDPSRITVAPKEDSLEVQTYKEWKAKPENANKDLSDYKKWVANLRPRSTANLLGEDMVAARKRTAQALAGSVDAKGNWIPGDLSPLSDITSMRQGERQLLYDEIKKINPAFSTSDMKRMVKHMDYLTTGKGAEQMQSYGTFLAHAGQMADAVKRMQLLNPKAANWTINEWRKQTGDPRYAELMVALEAPKKEFQSFLLNNRALYVEDRTSANEMLGRDMSPNAMMSALTAMGHTAKARMTEMDERTKRVMHVGIEEALGESPYSPEAEAAAAKLGIDLKREGVGGTSLIYVTDPTGKVWPFPTQQQADQFKRDAGIQ